MAEKTQEALKTAMGEVYKTNTGWGILPDKVREVHGDVIDTMFGLVGDIGTILDEINGEVV